MVPNVEPTLTLECRNHQIVQIIVNLLNNSFDAISELAEKWVELEVAESGPNIEIMITDSGAGLSLEVQQKLFQPFFSTKRVQYGTGLGLSISRSIVEGHKGQLLYDSSSPNTRFIVRLPRQHQKS